MRHLTMRLSVFLFITLSAAGAAAQGQAFNLEDHVQMVSLEVGNFAVADAGEGPAVVLMHGFPDTKEIWASQIEALSEAGYRVIAPDMRGRGESWSPLQVELYTLDKIQQDVLDIMDALGVDQAHLVGHPSSPAFSGFPQLASSWYI